MIETIRQQKDIGTLDILLVCSHGHCSHKNVRYGHQSHALLLCAGVVHARCTMNLFYGFQIDAQQRSARAGCT